MITETLPEVSPDPLDGEPSQRRRRVVVICVVVALVLSALGARAWWPEGKEDVRSGTAVVTSDELAATFGIVVTLIGVTAAGGLVEFRYQVVDPTKAGPVLHDASLHPILVVEDTGETLVLASPPHHHATDLQLGGTYFFLIANAHNAIRAGASITLVVGDVRLEHVIAQG